MWHQQIQILKKKVKQLERTESRNGILEVEGFIDGNRPRTMQGQTGINGGDCRSVKARSILRSGIEVDSVNIPIKSNLKNNTLSQHFMTTEMRKVSWSDAYGKDIAHVQEFEPRYTYFPMFQCLVCVVHICHVMLNMIRYASCL